MGTTLAMTPGALRQADPQPVGTPAASVQGKAQPDGASAFSSQLVAQAQAGQAGAAPPVDRRVKNPIFGTAGDNYVSQLVLVGGKAGTLDTNTRPQPGITVGAGGLFGISHNGGKDQYFVGVRGTSDSLPANRVQVGAERITSDDPVVSRVFPTVATTVTSQPLIRLTGKVGPLDASDVTSLSVTNFQVPVRGINVNFAGPVNAFALGKDGKTFSVVANSYQRVDNLKRDGSLSRSEADILRRDGIDPTGFGEPTRPLPSVDKNVPTLMTSALYVGAVAPDGRPANNPALAGGQVTVTFPVDEQRVPAWAKSLIQRIDFAQRHPDKPELLRNVLQDIQASPKLQSALAAWEQQEMGRAIKEQRPPPDWLHQTIRTAGDALNNFNGKVWPALGEGLENFGNFLRMFRGIPEPSL